MSGERCHFERVNCRTPVFVDVFDGCECRSTVAVSLLDIAEGRAFKVGPSVREGTPHIGRYQLVVHPPPRLLRSTVVLSVHCSFHLC